MNTSAASFLWADEPADVARPARQITPKPSRGHVPGEAGIWIFVLGDMTIFAVFFSVFVWENRGDRNLFAEATQALHQPIGAINTLVLLLSSYCVVRAVEAHRRDAARECVRALNAASACALVFAAVKAVEYTLEVSTGHTPGTNIFFTFYFVLTGIHLLHVLIGLALLQVWRAKARRGRRWMDTGTFAECAAVYWHMVDLLWIVIFTLLYLVCTA